MGVFHFKQFSVDDSRCSMKTGTDAVLLGAWVQLPANGSVLDVGCGSGVVAMMIAQRQPSLSITGIEIDPEAAAQAQANINNLPFGHSLQIVCEDVRTFAEAHPNQFDLVVSNPPYFRNSLRSPHTGRNNARHDTTLNYQQLIEATGKLLKKTGSLSVVLPFITFEDFRLTAASCGLFLRHKQNVMHQSHKEPVRTLALFGTTKETEPETHTLTLFDAEGMHHRDYLYLTKDFYLFA
jgi:tRNA1Val (adenine37-N6)-methyltransferase